MALMFGLLYTPFGHTIYWLAITCIIMLWGTVRS